MGLDCRPRHLRCPLRDVTVAGFRPRSAAGVGDRQRAGGAFQWEFSLSVLAAVLAVLGYSVNESVVVFDRVRETFKKVRGLSTPEVLDHAITSTISRTIITHGSTQMMGLSMLIFGGETLYYFALALTIGICFGIYSSVLVASPLVMWLGVSREQFIAKQKKVVEGANEEGAVV